MFTRRSLPRCVNRDLPPEHRAPPPLCDSFISAVRKVNGADFFGNLVTGSRLPGTPGYMTMTIPAFMTSTFAATDAELVAACQAGDRDAFGRIVERYQRLLCSLAYSATGSMGDSEDVAQETLIEAWRQLRSLREAEKLRAWLCGILRHKVGRLRRGNARQSVRRAETLEAAGEVSTTEESAVNLVMQEEEQAILWSELARVPEVYREPLVLYYREHRSLKHVAAALDLTEDAVKQRLARGRKLLQERVLAFVEGALERSTPGRAFTTGVLAALPAMLPAPAKAATLGTAMARGSTLAKASGFGALFASFTGAATALMGLRASLDQSRTPGERRQVLIKTCSCVLGSLAFLLVLWALRAGAYRWWEQRGAFAIACQILVFAFVVAWPVGIVRMMRGSRSYRSAERRAHPECFRDDNDQIGSSASEFRSRAKLFGVPLVHFRFSSPEEGDRPVFGWIAGGDRAFGLLFAWGGWAVAPISCGLCAVGLVSVGALGVGVIGLGTFAVGGIALGCVSIGVETYAWLSALGWSTAQSGGFGIARLAARAPVAYAHHVNDEMARQILANPHAADTQTMFLVAIVLLSMIPASYYMREVRRRMGRSKMA